MLPVAAAAQYVDPVISKDYLDRLKDSSVSKIFFTDTANNAKDAFLLLNQNFTGYQIKNIVIRHGYLKIQPAKYKTLALSGSFNSTVELKSIGRIPATQNSYVQGRSLNGNLSWEGPETNELFSYGPLINTLEFDGSDYPYDLNGRLVSKGAGNGNNATAYKNSVFRNASLLSQSIMLQGRYRVSSNEWLGRFKFGNSHENTFIRDNTNDAHDFSTLVEGSINSFRISAAFSTINKTFSNSNRNGFLNRTYQNSLLTPVSFENAQGTVIGNTQRSYSAYADNPLFLLEDNGNAFQQSHKTGNIALAKRIQKLNLRLTQSGEKLVEDAMENYKPGTAFFANGISTSRKKTDVNYFLNANASYDIRFNNDDFRSEAALNYIYGNMKSDIVYPSTGYHYQRSSNDFSMTYQTTYSGHSFDAGVKAENKFYVSNTSAQRNFFLPGISGWITGNDMLGIDRLYIKLVSTFNRFNSELPVSTSYAQSSLTRLRTDQSFQYFPVTEINGFNGLAPVRHKEWTGKIEMNYKGKLSFQGEIFNRAINDDIFPLYENGIFYLKNIADHRHRGAEFEMSYYTRSRNFNSTNSISFSSYKDIVTGIRPGYEFTAIAGFQNVNKAIVLGKNLGAIVGNRFLRDGNNNVIIGSDGYPLVDNNRSVIGNPIPDFVMKFNNSIEWKRFSLSLAWEWRKGGDIWNGTQAVLDYYGRSESTAALRNTTDFVFDGVSQNGHVNNTPVSFYDPNLPLGQNRWVRYGHSGVAEEYIQHADLIRLNNVGLNYSLPIKKYIQSISFTLYASNIVLWSAYKGTDPNQLLYDQANSNGLDFFNLPSLKSFGMNVSIQF